MPVDVTVDQYLHFHSYEVRTVVNSQLIMKLSLKVFFTAFAMRCLVGGDCSSFITEKDHLNS